MVKSKMTLNHKSNSTDVTMVSEDSNKIQAHKIILPLIRQQICKYYNKGYCRYKTTCTNIHYMQICTQIMCRNKSCESRHPVDCRYGSKCRRKMECLYVHNRYELIEMKIDKKDTEINHLKKENLLQIEAHKLIKSLHDQAIKEFKEATDLIKQKDLEIFENNKDEIKSLKN